LEALNKCLALQSNLSGDAYYCRGMAYYGSEEFDKAAADFSRALQLNSEISFYYLGRARAYARLGRLDEALADVDQFMKMEPNDASGPKLRGTIVESKRLAGGANQAEPAPTGGGAAVQAEKKFQQGWDQYKAGNYEQAIEAFNQAIALDPACEDAFHARGLSYWQKGEYFKAVDDYNKVLEINPNSNLVYFHRAVSLLELKKFDQALTDVEEYIKREPNDEDGPKLRQDIRKAKATEGVLNDIGVFKSTPGAGEKQGAN
jgi:tetratricopeptide (TPR) repeat protein